MGNQLGQKARAGAGRRKQDFAGDGFDPEGRDVPGYRVELYKFYGERTLTTRRESRFTPALSAYPVLWPLLVSGSYAESRLRHGCCEINPLDL